MTAAIACALTGDVLCRVCLNGTRGRQRLHVLYATLGELVAWIIGWDLLLEMALAAAVVARGWSAYLQSLLDLPTWLAGSPTGADFGAVAIVVALTALAVVGVKISGRVTAVLVVVKVAVVLFFIVAGLFFVKLSNLKPFIPASQPSGSESGPDGTLVQAMLYGIDFAVLDVSTAYGS